MNRKRQNKRAALLRELTTLADNIRDDQYNLLNQQIYKSELAGALKRNKLEHTRGVSADADRMNLSNKTKRETELNRRLFSDEQRDIFNTDLKKINRAIADMEIEIEYNRSILRIKLAGVENAIL